MANFKQYTDYGTQSTKNYCLVIFFSLLSNNEMDFHSAYRKKRYYPGVTTRNSGQKKFKILES